VYAYDADDPEELLPIWCRNLGPPVSRDEIFPGYLNVAGEVGITSTPVLEIDGKGTGTLYLVAKTLRFEDGQRTFRYEIHALDLLTGQTRTTSNGRIVVQARVLSPAGHEISFDAKLQLNRPGLLLLDGVLYLAFGSHGDVGDFYGWVMAYDARTLNQLAVYNTAPDWGKGGVWQSGTGLAGDKDGFVYVVVGNGESPNKNLEKVPPILAPQTIAAPLYGNAILKLKLDSQGDRQTLKVIDWFTASDTMDLNRDDNDFIGGPVLFEALDNTKGLREFILGGGKDGKFYLADRSTLGKWMPGANTTVLQEERLCAFHIHGAPVLWKAAGGNVVAFVWSEKDHLKAFAFDGTKFDGTRPLSTSVYGFPQDELRMPGGMLSLSWDGRDDDTAIVWASHPTDDDAMNKTVDGTLRAFDARDLNREILIENYGTATWIPRGPTGSVASRNSAHRLWQMARSILRHFRVSLPFMDCFGKAASRNVRMKSVFSNCARLAKMFSSLPRIRARATTFGSPGMESGKARTVSSLLTWTVIQIMKP
jgi:hypothetical protein